MTQKLLCMFLAMTRRNVESITLLIAVKQKNFLTFLCRLKKIRQATHPTRGVLVVLYPSVWYVLRFHLIHTKRLAPMWPNEESELKVLYDILSYFVGSPVRTYLGLK